MKTSQLTLEISEGIPAVIPTNKTMSWIENDPPLQAATFMDP